MRIIVRTLITIFTVSFCFAENFDQPVSAVPLSFTDALLMMQRSNDTLAAARSEQSQKSNERKAALGLYLPKIETKATYTQLNAPVTMDLNDIRTVISQVSGVPASAIPSFEKELVAEKFAIVDASLSWVLFSGGKISAANAAAVARLDEARYKYTDAQNRLITELVNRYFGVVFSSQLVDVRRVVLEGMEKHLSDAKSLEKNGMIAQVERLHAEVSYADAEREYKKAERTALLARTALGNSLSTEQNFQTVSALFIVKDIPDLSFYQSAALEHNPLLKQISANRALARQGYRKELAEFSPNVFVFANKELYGYHKPEFLPDWMIGGGLSCNLFEGMSSYYRVKAASDTEERVAALERKARIDISTLTEKYYQELMLAREQFDSLETSARFASEYVRVREKAFLEGAGTSLDVVDARLALAKVRTERLKAVYDFDCAFASLLEVSGLSQSIVEYTQRKDMEVSQ